jgi:hypothetical protein
VTLADFRIFINCAFACVLPFFSSFFGFFRDGRFSGSENFVTKGWFFHVFSENRGHPEVKKRRFCLCFRHISVKKEVKNWFFSEKVENFQKSSRQNRFFDKFYVAESDRAVFFLKVFYYQ